MLKRFFGIILSLTALLVSCNVNDKSFQYAYLRNRYNLIRAGDIKGANPTKTEVLGSEKGFVSYINLFNTSESYIDFHCEGTSFKDFRCIGSFRLVDKDKNVLIEKDSFECKYTGGQLGKVIIEDQDAKLYLGTIYVYTPYWCRWQFEYDVEGRGEKTLITFEFWKGKYNPLPDFVTKSN